MFHVKYVTMDTTTSQFKLKPVPNDVKLKWLQENQDFIAANTSLSLHDRFHMFPDFSWRKHMNNNITCAGVPKNLRQRIETNLK